MADKKGKISVEELTKLDSSANDMVFGNDSESAKETETSFDSIRNVINKISQPVESRNGEDVATFLTRVDQESRMNGTKNAIESSPNASVDINKMITGNQHKGIADILSNETSRIRLYENYNMIYDYIPQVAQAIDTIVDNIVSPDDCTKNTLNVVYEGTGDSDDIELINQNLQSLGKKYKIDGRRTERIITNSLKLGDSFVAVLKVNDEFNKILSEQYTRDLMKYNTDSVVLESKILNENLIEISDEEYKILNEDLLNDSLDDVNRKDRSKNDWSKEISHMLNNNIEFTSKSSSLLTEDFILNEDLRGYVANDYIDKAKNPNKYLKTEPEYLINNMPNPKADKSLNINISGAILKDLEPDRVIRLYLNGYDYGYFYIEKMEIDSENKSNMGTTSYNSSMFASAGYPTPDGNSDSLVNSKAKFITDMFVKNISKKIDKKFIEKNSQFKDAIYGLLQQEYILKKKVRITYLRPDEVIPFCNDEGHEGYGTSIMNKVLFTSKLYLAILTTTLLQKLVRSPQKRVFYVDTSLDNDTEQAVQSFVKDIKTKDIRINDFNDVNTVLSNIGMFSDLFIPTVDGNKPVEVDTLDGMDVDINNDFMEYLKNDIISGIGVPSAYIQASNEVEFSRELVMQNSKFVRMIVVLQKQIAESFTELYRKLYIAEYFNDKDAASKIDLNKIKINLNPPSSLQMTTLSDQINNSRDVIDFIVTSALGTEPDAELDKNYRQEVSRQLITGVDWGLMDELLQKAKLRTNEDKLKKASEEDTSTEESDSDSGSDDANPDF